VFVFAAEFNVAPLSESDLTCDSPFATFLKYLFANRFSTPVENEDFV
jgi:hypothetical protein